VHIHSFEPIIWQSMCRNLVSHTKCEIPSTAAADTRGKIMFATFDRYLSMCPYDTRQDWNPCMDSWNCLVGMTIIRNVVNSLNIQQVDVLNSSIHITKQESCKHAKCKYESQQQHAWLRWKMFEKFDHQNNHKTGKTKPATEHHWLLQQQQDMMTYY